MPLIFSVLKHVLSTRAAMPESFVRIEKKDGRHVIWKCRKPVFLQTIRKAAGIRIPAAFQAIDLFGLLFYHHFCCINTTGFYSFYYINTGGRSSHIF